MDRQRATERGGRFHPFERPLSRARARLEKAGRKVWTRLGEAAFSRSLAPDSLPRMPGEPLIGHFRAMRKDRFRWQIRTARQHPGIVRVPIGLFELVFVSSPELVHEVLVENEDAFVKSQGLSVFARPLLGNGLLTSEGAEHRRQRRIMAPLFTQRHIATYAGEMAERASAWALRLRESSEVDVASEAMRVTLEIVGKTLFDSEVAFEASAVGRALTTAMEEMMRALTFLVPVPPSVPTPGHRRARRAVGELDEVLYRMIRGRRDKPTGRTDVLSLLLAAKDEDGSRMSDVQVRDEAMTLFLAGHETTANALFWTLLLLGQNPKERARLEEEVDTVLGKRRVTYDDLAKLPLTLAALKEGMRLYPPAYILGRRAIREVTIGGHQIQPNMVVFVNIAGMHRRPDLFEAPDEFRIDRFLPEREKAIPRYAYLPFGAGPRICIGNHFALMEGQILLATLLQHLRLDPLAAGDVMTDPLITLRPKSNTRMRVEPR